MHIMEGFLPWQWCVVWWIIAIPFLFMGVIQLRSMIRNDRDTLPLLGVCGAFIFILSALKLPSVTGSCSHPTGTGLSTMCFGVCITSIIGAIVLLFQSLLLAHGGLSTLGANMVSMAIGGPLAGYAIYRLLKNSSLNIYITVFLVTAVADLVTYVITSFELAVAYPSQVGGIIASFGAFFAIFAVTQLPLAIVEGCVLALVFKYIIALKPEILIKLQVFSEDQISRAQQQGSMVTRTDG
ncbi:MAG: energy-coupling factor ABC transporter permease [Methanospirillum sp.]|uniref:energy-coupling factor ABC transporter permease n=1 Tax=Methanospirillum sp. TaxID=45200 RepID=UPI00236C5105|nr:energy-coupling factor ABC transporter permease [Methanospirillum sp.]MDD1728039.1 energy-coupling factor ABC transporter permease [Methanospirillum sp.]